MNIRDHLIDDWKGVLKSAHSVKLAAAAPIVIQALWWGLSSAPPEVRVIVGTPVLMVLCGVAILARIWKQ